MARTDKPKTDTKSTLRVRITTYTDLARVLTPHGVVTALRLLVMARLGGGMLLSTRDLSQTLGVGRRQVFAALKALGAVMDDVAHKGLTLLGTKYYEVNAKAKAGGQYHKVPVSLIEKLRALTGSDAATILALVVLSRTRPGTPICLTTSVEKLVALTGHSKRVVMESIRTLKRQGLVTRAGYFCFDVSGLRELSAPLVQVEVEDEVTQDLKMLAPLAPEQVVASPAKALPAAQAELIAELAKVWTSDAPPVAPVTPTPRPTEELVTPAHRAAWAGLTAGDRALLTADQPADPDDPRGWANLREARDKFMIACPTLQGPEHFRRVLDALTAEQPTTASTTVTPPRRLRVASAHVPWATSGPQIGQLITRSVLQRLKAARIDAIPELVIIGNVELDETPLILRRPPPPLRPGCVPEAIDVDQLNTSTQFTNVISQLSASI